MTSQTVTESVTRTRLPDRPDVFISYSRRDQAFVADRLVPELTARGKEVWVDVEDIPPAAQWRATMLDGIAKSAAFVFVLSPDSLRSEVCAEELARAVELNKRLVPVALRPVDAAEAPPALQQANWILLDDVEAGLERIVEALETDLEWRQAHTRLAVRTAEWLREGRDRSFLLRGSDLRHAEDWLSHQADHAETATAEQTDYILRSRQAATRRQRITLAAVAIALAVAVALAVVALAQRREAVRQAQVAQSRELAATSLARVGRDPELAVLLAVEATRRAETEQAEDALREALTQWPERRALRAAGTFRSVQPSPDGRSILVTGADAVELRDAGSGRLVRRIPVAGGGVRTARLGARGRLVSVATAEGALVAEAATGRVVANVGSSGLPPSGADLDAAGRRLIVSDATGARVHDVRSGRLVAPLRDPLTTGALLTPGGHVAVTYGARESVSVWDVGSGRRIDVLRHDEPVMGATLSPDGRLLVVSTLQGIATVWQVPSGRKLATLRHLTPVNGASFSPDGRLLFTASSYGRIWDVATRRTVHTLRQPAQVVASAFSPDGRRLITGDIEGVARVWDVASGREVERLVGHEERVDAVSLVAGGRLAVTGGRDGTVRIWEAAGGAGAIPLRRDGDRLEAAVLAPDRRVVATVGEQGVVRVHDAADGSLRAELPGPGGAAGSAAFSADGSVLAVAGDRGAARTYSLPEQRALATLQGHAGRVEDVAVSPDGVHAATVGQDGTVRVWHARTGASLVTLGPFGDIGGTEVVFAQDGRRLAAQVGEGVGLASVPAGEELAAIPSAFGLAASPDGATLAIGGIGGVALHSAGDGSERGRRTAPDGIFDLSFSPDGRLLTGVSPTGGGYVWDLRGSGTLLRLRRPAVYALAIAPGNRYAAAGLERGGVVVYELGSEQRVATLGAGRPRTDTVTFGASERSLIALDRGGGAWLYPCDACRSLPGLVALARERAIRPLTAEERARYLHEDAAGE